MENRERISEFVEELDRYSGGILSEKDGLRFLLEIALEKREEPGFERLAFLSKFAAKSRKIMERIGVDGEGYEKLSAELSASLREIVDLLTRFTTFAPDTERSRFSQTYLSMTPDSLQRLFSLLSDLGWYKNWRIDHRDWKLS
jgi:hypothetical protein